MNNLKVDTFLTVRSVHIEPETRKVLVGKRRKNDEENAISIQSQGKQATSLELSALPQPNFSRVIEFRVLSNLSIFSKSEYRAWMH